MLAGCAADWEQQLENGATVFIEPQSQDVEMNALMQGTLVINDNNCVVVVTDISGNENPEVLPTFPHGTTIDGDTIVMGTTTLNIGDPVSLGGGGFEIKKDSDTSQWGIYHG